MLKKIDLRGVLFLAILVVAIGLNVWQYIRFNQAPQGQMMVEKGEVDMDVIRNIERGMWVYSTLTYEGDGSERKATSNFYTIIVDQYHKIPEHGYIEVWEVDLEEAYLRMMVQASYRKASNPETDVVVNWQGESYSLP